jgi:putative endonuclease
VSGDNIEVVLRRSGPVAQLGARFHGMEEVVGSIPTRSTKTPLTTNYFLRVRACREGSRLLTHPPMFAVYILESQSTSKFYIGCTADVGVRLAEHQRGQTVSTRGRGPWKLVYQEAFETSAEARQRERQLKNWKSHRSIQELIEAAQINN